MDNLMFQIKYYKSKIITEVTINNSNIGFLYFLFHEVNPS